MLAELIGNLLFHKVRPNHIENRPLICSKNQWTGFYMGGTSVMQDLIRFLL